MKETRAIGGASLLIAQGLSLAGLGVTLFFSVISLPWLGVAAIDGYPKGLVAIGVLIAIIAVQVALMMRSQSALQLAPKVSFLLASLFPLALLLFVVTR